MADQELDQETIAKLAAMAQQELESDDLDDEPEEESSSEHHVSLAKYNKLRQKYNDANARIERIEREIQQERDSQLEQQRDLDLKSGEFSKVIDSQKAEINTLKAQLQKAELDTERLIIGRKIGLPDAVARLIPGSSPEIILNNAEQILAELPKQSGFVDGAIGSNAVLQSNNTPHYPELEGGAF